MLLYRQQLLLALLVLCLPGLVTAQYVGIGHTAPDVRLDIDGALKVRNDTIYGGPADVDFNFISNGGFVFQLDNNASAAETFRLLDGSNSPIFQVEETGNARVYNDLRVDGLAGASLELVSANASGILGRFAFSGNSTDVLDGDGNWTPFSSLETPQDLGSSVTGTNVTISISDGGSNTTFNDNDWGYNGSDIYNLNTGGEVGIGINSPTYQLQVQDIAIGTGVGYFYNQSPISGSFGLRSDVLGGARGYMAIKGEAAGAFDGSGYTMPIANAAVGLFGVSNDGSSGDNWGVMGYSNGWAGRFEHSSGNFVQLGGSSALQIVDGSEAAGRVLISDGSGNASWSALAVDDADADPSNELQDLSSSASADDRTIDITGGASTTINIADSDADATNEFQDLGSSAMGDNRTITISDGTSTTINIADGDADPSNEIQSLSYVDTTGYLTISGSNTLQVNQVISEPIFSSTGGVLFTHPTIRGTVTWNGTTNTVTYTHGSSGFVDVTIFGSSGNTGSTNRGISQDVKTAGGTVSAALNWTSTTYHGFIVIVHDESGNGGFVMHCSVWSNNVGGIVQYYY